MTCAGSATGLTSANPMVVGNWPYGHVAKPSLERKDTVISKLFTPIKMRDLEVRNRVFVAPMCQYSAEDGMPTDWHTVHLGTRASGGAGLVIAEATAVSPEGRITPWDLGIWNDDQANAYRPMTDFIRSQGSIPAMQIAHAGRKASTNRPWKGGKLLSPGEGGWTPVGPSTLPFSEDLAVPSQLTVGEIKSLVTAWTKAAERALTGGFDVVELHFAHGYLIHEFLSPISNTREDEYGGSPENRARFPLEIARSIRAIWPDHLPLFVRISATEYVEGGWDIDDAIQFCGWLKEAGVDFIDTSSGGNSPAQKFTPFTGYQVPFAAAIREQVGIATGAVGMITEPEQAEKILEDEQADAILLGRELLRNPYWPLQAAATLGDKLNYWPNQYLRAAVYPNN
jgi:2,4-dienoyl-CoA reductase-like NADH-dependent reductase (Old Yellow Enzyme family)